jgi:hypothetical protein
MNKEKVTVANKIEYLGAAIKSGQDLEGVENGP